MKKIAGYISPLQNFLASPPQNEIRAARPVKGGGQLNLSGEGIVKHRPICI